MRKFKVGDKVCLKTDVNRMSVVAPRVYEVQSVDQDPTATYPYTLDWQGQPVRFGEHELVPYVGSFYTPSLSYSIGLEDFSSAAHSDNGEALKKKRKEEGRCEECGELRPMSIWGLGPCKNQH